jgi:hypothetical protein
MIDLVGHEQPHHLGQSYLDGIRVLESGQGDGAALDGSAPDGSAILEIHVDLRVFLVALQMVVTIFLVGERGRSALGSVDFNMLTAANTDRI